MSDPGRQPLAPPASSADVGVVTAMSIEAGHLIDRLSRVRRYTSRSLTVVEGELEGLVVAVLSSGVGEASARRGVEHLLAGHRPNVLVSAGFAGALSSDLQRNDLVTPRAVLDGAGGLVELDVRLTGAVPSVRTVDRMLMVDHVVTSTREKAALHEKHGADLVDMETYAAAVATTNAVEGRDVRFLSLRVVSDDARTELPADVGRLLNASGSYRVGAALRALVGRPSALKDFWSLHAHAMECADRLADAVQILLRQLS